MALLVPENRCAASGVMVDGGHPKKLKSRDWPGSSPRKAIALRVS
jgi:hypothetical protein